MGRELTPIEAYESLPAETKSLIDSWIVNNIRPAETIYPGSSYWLKHVVERHIGTYVSSSQVTGAMEKAGYSPVKGFIHPWKFRMTFIGQE